MDSETRNTMGKVSLCAAIAGIVGAVMLALVLVVLESLAGIDMPISLCVFLFVGLEIVALVTGIVGWRSPCGKAGLGASIVLLGLITFFMPVSSVRGPSQSQGVESRVDY